MADEVPLVLWDCIFPEPSQEEAAAATAGEAMQLSSTHDADAEVNTHMEDAVDWVYVSERGSRIDLTNQMWEYWREKRMDELLANRLLDLVSSKVTPTQVVEGGSSAVHRKGYMAPLIYEGGNSGLSRGEYVPLLKRQTQDTVEELNDKYAQSKGFTNSGEMTQNKHWRSALREAKASARTASADVDADE